MSKLIDLTGQKFGRLTVIGRAENTRTGRARWFCLCECGSETVVTGYCLSGGKTQSCGCYQKDQIKEFNRVNKVTHGGCVGSRTRLYRIWSGMKQRCYDKNYHSYNDYGGRGVGVCVEWMDNFESFRTWAMLHGYADNLSIDRKDVNGSYSPDNCRWATEKQQNNNQRSNVFYVLNGESKTLSEWADIYGIDYFFLWQRITRAGMSLDEALTRPVRKCSNG